MTLNNAVGLDSQCLTYIVDAMHDIKEPKDDLAGERKSLLRIFLYTSMTFVVSYTVRYEVSKIRSFSRRDLHNGYINIHFLDPPVSNPSQVSYRTSQFFALHNKKNDCRILAEAEDLHLNVLLTYDQDFWARLRYASSKVKVMKPSTYWHSLGVSKGTKPVSVPKKTNPLSKEDWWKW